MKRNISIINKRKRIWDIMGYNYVDQPNRLFKNHQLTDNCSCCRWTRFMKKYENKAKRRSFKSHLIKELDYE